VIINITINYKKDIAFVLAKESDELFFVLQFNMNSKMKVTEFQIKGNYIKAENIE